MTVLMTLLMTMLMTVNDPANDCVDDCVDDCVNDSVDLTFCVYPANKTVPKRTSALLYQGKFEKEVQRPSTRR
jgi:hypothetical protein